MPSSGSPASMLTARPGRGMLTGKYNTGVCVTYLTLKSGAICGNIFASPSAQQVKRGIEYVDNEQG